MLFATFTTVTSLFYTKKSKHDIICRAQSQNCEKRSFFSRLQTPYCKVVLIVFECKRFVLVYGLPSKIVIILQSASVTVYVISLYGTSEKIIPSLNLTVN